MKSLIGALGLLVLASTNAWAEGDLLVTSEWTAQSPEWSNTKTSSGTVHAQLQKAWLAAAKPDGPICKTLWEQFGPKLQGAGGCIRNLYTTGNTCSLDQNPTLSVSSSGSGIAVEFLATNTNLEFTTSMKGACETALSTVYTGKNVDPRWHSVLPFKIKALLPMSDNQFSVGSATAQLVGQPTLTAATGAGDATSTAMFILNLAAIFDPSAINSALSGAANSSFNVASEMSTSIGGINTYVKGQIGINSKLPGFSTHLTTDSGNVHVVGILNQCIPGQTSGKLPCDGSTVCLTPSQWGTVSSHFDKCKNKWNAEGHETCSNVPGPALRTPELIPTWFNPIAFACDKPSATQAKTDLTNAQNALGQCQLNWEGDCLAKIPACPCPGMSGGSLKCKAGPSTPASPASASCATASAADAAAEAKCLKSPSFQSCQQTQQSSVNSCQSTMKSASAGTCANQLGALSKAKKICSEISGCSD